MAAKAAVAHPGRTHQTVEDADLILSVPKQPDIDTHVRVVRVEGVEVLEIRDYIDSLGEYGRGYWFPLEALDDVIAAFQQVKASIK